MTWNGSVGGNVGSDAKVRDAGESRVCGFSLAHNDPFDKDAGPTWFDIEIWGKRGERLAEMINKGDKIVVWGDFSTRVHDGKTYHKCKATDVFLCGNGPKKDDDDRGRDDRGSRRDDRDDRSRDSRREEPRRDDRKRDDRGGERDPWDIRR